MTKKQNKSLGLIIGLCIALLMLIRSNSMLPPLKKQYDKVSENIYKYYLAHGNLPEFADLSSESRKIITTNNGITYTPKNGITYMYGDKYPINVPFVGIITFGVWWGGTETCSGTGQPPETLIHNAKLRKDQ